MRCYDESDSIDNHKDGSTEEERIALIDKGDRLCDESSKYMFRGDKLYLEAERCYKKANSYYAKGARILNKYHSSHNK
jgi:hypothetical protein